MKSIYVELDCILDTRLPILYSISPTIAEEVIVSDYYFNRIKDKFGLISADIFKSFYNNRTKGVLKYAGFTPCLYYVSELYSKSITDIVNLEIRNEIEIYINTYPYFLNGSEQVELEKGIKVFLGDIPTRIVNISNKDLTPEWLTTKGFDHVIKYDLLEWYEYHMSNYNLIKNPLYKMNLHAPGLLDVYSPESLFKDDVFDKIIRLAKFHSNLDIMHISDFCKLKPKKEKK